jgi:phytoene dehydrogenase-like protein
MRYDAVVIGAGHNGLAAAARLADRGWSVDVVEANAEPGGAVKTRELTLPGFRHDLCAMNLSMFAGSGFFAAHKDALLAHGLAFAPATDCFATARFSASAGIWRRQSRAFRRFRPTARRRGAISSRASDSMLPMSSLFWARPCPRWRPRMSFGRLGGREARAGSWRRCGCCWRRHEIFSTRDFRIPKSRR